MKELVPKGKLVAIGGNVDKGTDPESAVSFKSLNFFEFGILQRILSETKDYQRWINRIKSAMDPDDVLAPGRYGIGLPKDTL